MPPITSQDFAISSDGGVHDSVRSFMALGLGTVLVLCLIDVVGGLAMEHRMVGNLSGTLVLAPALTALSRSRPHTLLVGCVALIASVALALYDGVPWATAMTRVLVVLASAVLSVVVAQAQARQWAQLQDRRQAARTLQAAMLTQLPQADDLQLLSRYLPASSGDQVGGDWYDALVDADGCMVLVIGDVVGHDMHAAAAMGQLRGLLRAYAVEGGQSPARLLQRVDEGIARLGLEVLATVVVVRIEQDAPAAQQGVCRARWSNAGHPPPMMLLPGGDANLAASGNAAGDTADGAAVRKGPRVQLLEAGEADPMLGLGLFEVQRHDHVVDVVPTSTLLLYTDGLIERREQSLDEGLRRLTQAMADARVQRLVNEQSGSAGVVLLDRWLDGTCQGG
ncbi:PP2C family protein-serine/threonine phosphatase [Kineococcus arenarius]|uniref:PP2C family protein-serine/threonine phosphatase n=1 Tax=Kineococcus sp. SYSU DK007 TaxID=3383128 RepID=UPI003D7D46B5